jgi:uncharacterized protein (DUF1330 family)
MSTASAPADAPVPTPVFVVLQGRLKPGGQETYDRYLAGTIPLMHEYGATVVCVGAGIESPHANRSWPLNGVLKFPSEQAVLGFFGDPRYAEVKKLYRDAAYEEVQISFFLSRPPRTG